MRFWVLNDQSGCDLKLSRMWQRKAQSAATGSRCNFIAIPCDLSEASPAVRLGALMWVILNHAHVGHPRPFSAGIVADGECITKTKNKKTIVAVAWRNDEECNGADGQP